MHGIRQVDDLIMWVSYDKNSLDSEAEADAIITELLNTETKQSRVYKDGLTLTEETVTTKKKRGTKIFKADFAGTIIEGDFNAQTFTTQTLNKNWHTIRLLNRQRFQKLPHYKSYIHPTVKRVGMTIRLDTQNSTEHLFKRHFARSIMELKSIDYTEHFITHALSTLQKRVSWRHRILWMKNITHTIFNLPKTHA